MENRYWIGRKRSAMGMAREAATAEARLIHYDLAGRYSVKAALTPPFMLPGKGPATIGERAVLHLPACAPPHSRGKPDKPGKPGADGR
jgi:hypothetical protein